MPIDWNTFKQTLRSYFDGKTSQSENETAKFLATQYTTAILQGGDVIAGNVVIVQQPMTLALESAFNNAFSQAKQTTDIQQSPFIFGSAISQGLITFWTGAQLSPLIPPPGSISVVPPNTVVVAGAPILRLEVGYDIDFTNSLVSFFQQHLQTLSGITIALIPATPSPIPTPFPWTGYV